MSVYPRDPKRRRARFLLTCQLSWKALRFLQSLHLVGLLLGLVTFLTAGSIEAEEKAFPEIKLKAALLYQFAKFTSWPSNAFESLDSPIKIGFIGNAPLKEFLTGIVKGKEIAGRKIDVESKGDGDNISDCQILFIGATEKERLTEILAAVKGRPVLTISEIDKFAAHGGMIRFLRKGNNLGFELNVQATEEASLKISSTLGAFGNPVRTGPK